MHPNIASFAIHLADDSLIMSQRLSEWTGHGPALELDIALTNIALDYLGQARIFFQYAAMLKGGDATEDSLAYLRDAHEFRNHLLLELPNGDWGQTILKVFLFSAWQKPLLQQLQNCPDQQIAAIAIKTLKEVTYHLRWSSDWVMRLGNGTEESKGRMNNALQELWPYTGELFETPIYSADWVDYGLVKEEWQRKISEIFEAALLSVQKNGFYQKGGINGVHTEHLGYLLAEMQFLQRAYPNSEW
jgi:ring-1,2-phenylacetyl-CoA epoxidase subunit PaaC